MKHAIRWTCVLVCLLGPGATAAAQSRPDGFTMGIGAGWDFPTDIQNVNIASARFRLVNGVTFEPRVDLSIDTDKDEFAGTDQTDKSSVFAMAALVRFPLMGRGPVDMVGIGGAVIDYSKTNPEGPDNNTTNSTFGLVYGLSVEYWWGPRWSLSFSALNPVFGRSKTTQQVGPDTESTSTSTGFGAVWDPDIFAMIHLYY